jgi:hypothetical protein
MALKANLFETSLLAGHRLGLPPLLYHELREIKDDWGFVLKLHAFFEGALTHTVAQKLRRIPSSREGLMPRDSFTSRVYLADRLGVLEPDAKAFLLALNRLRNDLTHNIRFIDFDLQRYVHSLSDSDFAKAARILCTHVIDVQLDSACAQVVARALATRRRISTARQMLFHRDPRASLWFSGLFALDLLSLHCIFELSGGKPVNTEANLEGILQDLLHDPAVIEYKRRFKPFWSWS